MQSNFSVISWLAHLRLLHPPTCVILVGAGTGLDPLVKSLQEWELPSVVMFEADEERFIQLEKNIFGLDGWKAFHQVVGEKSGITTYYEASYKAESGLIEPEQLQFLWPNLTTKQVQSKKALALGDLLNSQSKKWEGLQDLSKDHSYSPAAKWLWIDCLPSLPILKGAVPLNFLSVIVARVVLSEVGSQEDRLPAAGIDELETFLKLQGFRLLNIDASRNPSIGNALFIRDFNAEINKFLLTIDQLKKLFRDVEHKSIETTKNLDNLARAHVSEKIISEGRQREIYALKQEITADRELLREKEDIYKQLRQTLEKTEEDNSHMLTQVESKAARTAIELQQVVQAKATAEKLVLNLKNQLGSISQSNNKTNENFLEQKQKNENLEKELDVAIAGISQLKEQLIKNSKKNAVELLKITNEKSAMETRASELQRRIEGLCCAKSEADRKLVEQQRKIDRLQQELDVAEAGLVQKKEEIIRNSDQNASDFEAMTAANNRSEQMASELQQKIEFLTLSKNAVDKRIVEQKQLIGRLQQELDVANARISQDQAVMAENLAALENINKDKVAVDSIALQRQAQVEKLSKEKIGLDKLCAERSAQIQALELRLLQIKAVSAESEQIRGQFEAEILKAHSQIALIIELFMQESENE